MLEYCLWRSYVPEGETYAIDSFFAPRSCLAAAAVSERKKRELHTTLQHKAHHTGLHFHIKLHILYIHLS